MVFRLVGSTDRPLETASSVPPEAQVDAAVVSSKARDMPAEPPFERWHPGREFEAEPYADKTDLYITKFNRLVPLRH